MCERIIHNVAAMVVDPITLITVVLTALCALLAALAIVIGVLSIWGYRGIKDEARKIATEAAHKKLVEYFENEALRDKIRLMATSATISVPPHSIKLEVSDEMRLSDNVQLDAQLKDVGNIYTGQEDKNDASNDDPKSE